MTMTHGGPRKGAGRLRKTDLRRIVNFTLSQETIRLLHEKVPSRGRSKFVETTIIQALERK